MLEKRLGRVPKKKSPFNLRPRRRLFRRPVGPTHCASRTEYSAGRRATIPLFFRNPRRSRRRLGANRNRRSGNPPAVRRPRPKPDDDGGAHGGPGTAYPCHVHDGPEECYVHRGELCVAGETLRAGDYQRAAPGSLYVVQSTENGCLLLIVSSMTDELVE